MQVRYPCTLKGIDVFTTLYSCVARPWLLSGPRLEGYPVHKKKHPPWDNHSPLGIGPLEGPWGRAVLYERGTPVEVRVI